MELRSNDALTRLDKSVFEKLFQEVNKAELIGPSRHTAAIVHKGQILCVGYSKKKTHPLMLKFQTHKDKIHLHAEIDAISKVKDKKILKDCDLYVFRLSRGNNIGLSKPCATCENAIRFYEMKNVYWTINEHGNDRLKF